MAQNAAGSAQAAPRARPHPSRVVPAIPHALTAKHRAARSRPQPSPQPTAAPSTPSPVDAPPATATVATGPADEESTNGVATPTISSSTPQPPNPATQATGAAGVARLEDDKVEAGASVDVGHSAAGHGSTPLLQTNVRELPPPFYPSNPQSNPQSNPSSAASNSIHREPLSARSGAFPGPNGTLVFGGRRESANSSPAPAAMGAPHAHVQQTPFAPPPGFPVPGFLPPGHAHHLSEPFVGPAYHPPYIHGQPPGLSHPHGGPGPFGQPRPLYPGPRYPNGNRSDRGYSPRAQSMRPFPPAQGNVQDRSVEPFSPNAGPPQSGSHGRPFPPANAHKPHESSDDAFALSQYLRSQFGNREFADHVVSISHTSYSLSPGKLACHGVILARSPKLRSLMAMQSSEPSSYPKTLALMISDRFINHDAVIPKCISHLYGEPLVDDSFIVNVASVAPSEKGQAFECLRLSLAYAAMGHFLQVGQLVTRGIDLASGFLAWPNLPLALSFSLDGGLGASWAQHEVINEEKGSSSSFDETKNDSPASAPIYGIYSDRLLHNIVHFLVSRFPVDFVFALSVSQLPEIPRLPSNAQHQHARTASRLSQIRFGEMTLDDKTIDPVMDTLSAILISLPLALLKHVLEHPMLLERVGPAKVADVMRTAVDERERRRLRVESQPQPANADSALEERLWNTVRWAESVEPIAAAHPAVPTCGLRLVRHRVGVETPPASVGNKG